MKEQKTIELQNQELEKENKLLIEDILQYRKEFPPNFKSPSSFYKKDSFNLIFNFKINDFCYNFHSIKIILFKKKKISNKMDKKYQIKEEAVVLFRKTFLGWKINNNIIYNNLNFIIINNNYNKILFYFQKTWVPLRH